MTRYQGSPGRFHRLLRRAGVLLAAMALPATAQSPTDLNPARTAVAATAAPVGAGPVVTGRNTAALTAGDVNAWLDGFLPYALDAGAVAGAVVVVVKDGQVLTARGYGHADMRTRKPVDPARTLFRPGSISKLFTWTAVMQQVQAGKLDLDRDVNAYLDFKIPEAYGKPITLRHLMTHTAGFEETAKYLIVEKASQKHTLGEVLKRWVPTRIYAPGAMPAYSNYGASLAGYIVERVSGERFEDYVQRHIFTPLDMRHSSFEQPLPARLAPLLSKGYDLASEDPRPFEIIEMAPAGALSSTGDDMARFMLAFLDNRGALISPAIRQRMFADVNRPIPGLPAMALGFYHEDRNGQVIVGHGGDTNWFHSDLHLIVDQGVGLYMSFNSGGKDAAAHVIRQRIFEQFMDRYYPDERPAPPTVATARDHGRLLAGHYLSSRASTSNWLRLVGMLGEAEVSLNPDDTISVSALTNPAGVPKRWREVAPWQWREVGGTSLLGATVENGKVTSFSIGEFAPIFLFLPATADMDAGWIIPTILAALAIMLLTALAWPVVAILRRVYGHRSPLAGRPLLLDRVMRGSAVAALAVAAGWMGMLGAIDSDVGLLDGRLDIWMRLIQLIEIVGIVATLVSVYNAYITVRSPDRTLFAKLWSVLVPLAGLFLAWIVISKGLLTFGLDY
ncbi:MULTISPECIES: serine hydrolase domain-containing protein [unclassified Sphingomonas]|uniref:serine hydrolase domain-containing protein n=1 Tax=unclassified Sphingomonas TaxID=196159 RepID=UPI0006FE0963|nr:MULTISPECIES: serine hydrolase domain-containing protein [unclassified Sphingomonas]KQX25622.1 serine hydrolase [Sphingomonas sp. Root1294]KQY66613.1 serine hydrolase [Sphingomonas sp. Root50]KRB90063.1 serine hydrolase [Sphingomonas sp. Root720]